MRIETRYSIGDIVWGLTVSRAAKTNPCGLCSATGSVGIADTDRTTTCPDCHGRGRLRPTEQELHGHIQRLTIGQVNTRNEAERVERTYMAEETGVGSGRVWNEANLYPAVDDAKHGCTAAGAILQSIKSAEVSS